MIRAKFTVNQTTKGLYGNSVRLMPVTSGSEEDRAFFKATPSGQIELVGITEEVVSLFGEPGAKFYVDFTAVPEPRARGPRADHADGAAGVSEQQPSVGRPERVG